MWLYGAVRPRAISAHLLNGWIAGRSIRLTPGGSAQWRPPVPTTDLEDWLLGLEEIVNSRIAHTVVQLPSDRRRRRFSLLLMDHAGAPIAFAKFTMNPSNGMAIEAMRRFGENPPSGYWAPRLLADGVLGAYSYTVTSPMPNSPHFPATLSPQKRRQIVGDIQSRLADLVEGTKVAIHGYFGAWNVRSFRGGSIAIVDWEATAQGVPAADELWHVFSWMRTPPEDLDVGRFLRTELPHHDPRVVSHAAQFWLEKLDQPETKEVDPDTAISHRLEQAATGMRGLLELLTERVG